MPVYNHPRDAQQVMSAANALDATSVGQQEELTGYSSEPLVQAAKDAAEADRQGPPEETMQVQTASNLPQETPSEAQADEAEAPSAVAQPISDLDLIRAEVLPYADGSSAPGSSNTNGQGGASSDLQRLRNLVLATRGTKAQLPPGWDDTAEEQPLAQADVVESSGVANDMLDSAIAKVGAQVSDPESSGASTSSSDSEDDSSDSGSDLDEDIKLALQKNAAHSFDDDGDDEDDDGGASGSKARGPATKNEVVDLSVEPLPYALVPDGHDVRLMGKVHSIVDNVVVVAQQTGMAPGAQRSQAAAPPPVDRQGRVGEQEGEYSVLDTGSLLAFEDRSVLGIVYETFGSVQGPLYAVRFPSSSSIDRDVICIGKPVGYVPTDSTYVLTRALRALGKGSDASNLYDEEVGDEEREFSDDEAEAMSKAARKAAKKAGGGGAVDAIVGKGRKRGSNDHGRAADSNTAPSIRHGLPARPVGVAAMAAHRDMDQTVTSARALPLPYDDDDGSEAAAATTTILPALYVSPMPLARSTGHQAAAPTHPAFQHIRPSAQTMNTGRGRGRGRGALPSSPHGNGSTHGAYNPAFAQPTTAAGWPQPQDRQGYAQQAYPQQYPSAYGQGGGGWLAAYTPGTHSQPYAQQSYQHQTAYAAPQPQPSYAYTGTPHGQGVQAPSDSLGSYDPNQPHMTFTPQSANGSVWPQTGHPPAWQQ